MPFSIFHSQPQAFSSNSKQLNRTDVEDESQVQEVATEILKKGHTINALIKGYGEKKEAPTRQRRG